jgi:hypothetical protein
MLYNTSTNANIQIIPILMRDEKNTVWPSYVVPWQYCPVGKIMVPNEPDGDEKKIVSN